MRDVLSHPFFGIGKLAGVAPVFDRPKLGQATKIVDINSTNDANMIQSKEAGTGTKAETKNIDAKIEPDDASSPVNEMIPVPLPITESNVLLSEILREVEQERIPTSAPIAPPPVLVKAAPAPAPASVSRVSKFGIKGIKFGKKK